MLWTSLYPAVENLDGLRAIRFDHTCAKWRAWQRCPTPYSTRSYWRGSGKRDLVLGLRWRRHVAGTVHTRRPSLVADKWRCKRRLNGETRSIRRSSSSKHSSRRRRWSKQWRRIRRRQHGRSRCAKEKAHEAPASLPNPHIGRLCDSQRAATIWLSIRWL